MQLATRLKSLGEPQMPRQAALLPGILRISFVMLALAVWAMEPVANANDGASVPADARTVTVAELTDGEHVPLAIDYWSLLFVFVLATFIGIGVIGGVSRLLHTPLMSLTNAISAIAIVGAIIVTGGDHPTPIRVLGAIALFASTTNIVSGFLITDRMLKMFKQTRENTKA
jgi:H+-translocating NAD(P) transhydrogenase subunit alpha